MGGKVTLGTDLREGVAVPRNALIEHFQLTLQSDELAHVGTLTVLEKADLNTEIRPFVTQVD